MLHWGFPLMIPATQLRPGMVIKFNKELFSVFKMEHRTPGNLRGFVQVKMRNFRTGTMMEHRFSSEDKVERAALRFARVPQNSNFSANWIWRAG